MRTSVPYVDNLSDLIQKFHCKLRHLEVAV